MLLKFINFCSLYSFSQRERICLPLTTKIHISNRCFATVDFKTPMLFTLAMFEYIRKFLSNISKSFSQITKINKWFEKKYISILRNFWSLWWFIVMIAYGIRIRFIRWGDQHHDNDLSQKLNSKWKSKSVKMQWRWPW